MYASPMYASAGAAHAGGRPSSARPAVEPWVGLAATRLASAAAATTSSVSVVVLDTGLAMPAFHSAALGSLLPLLTASTGGRRPARRRR